MIHVSSGALNRRGTACALEAASDWRTSKRSRRSHRRSVSALLSRTKTVQQSAAVEFIDENGEGPECASGALARSGARKAFWQNEANLFPQEQCQAFVS